MVSIPLGKKNNSIYLMERTLYKEKDFKVIYQENY